MVIYKNTSSNFVDDVERNLIVESIKRSFVQQIGWFPVKEVESWTNSLNFMATAVRKSGINGDCGVFIEYGINSTRKRIDFAVSGYDDNHKQNIVIVELKQWDDARATDKDSVVLSTVNRVERELTHPSYQAFTYKTLLTDFYEIVDDGTITPYSCAFLHNLMERSPEPLKSPIYDWVVKDSPLFFKHDTEKIQEFIRRRVRHGRGMAILDQIETSERLPTKRLIDHVCSMYAGNSAFTLIDGQKVAFENALQIVERATKKTVLIVKGGPGTGKSVISFNLLGELLKRGYAPEFVTPNAAFRDVMTSTLAREESPGRLKSLFKSSGSYFGERKNSKKVVIVDEAHRLKNGSAYRYNGENQVDDIIKSAFVSLFFIDDAQRVRPEDIGSVAEIRKIAGQYGAGVKEFELEAQYRCAGADGFIGWLDNLLQLDFSANADGWDRKDFEFKVFDDPNKLRKAIKAKQRGGFSARMLAGYAWKWTNKGNPRGEVEDVTIPEYRFKMPWNSRQARTTWAIDESGVDQIGCIHTSQGLEFDYVGVIIGPDLAFNAVTNTYSVDWRNYKDLVGKRGLKKDPERLSQLVRNIYKTLMSRAQKGCYVYVCDEALAAHVNERVEMLDSRYVYSPVENSPSLLDRVEEFIDDNLKFKSFLPVYSLKAACGRFGGGELVEPAGWIRIEGGVRITPNMFVVRAAGTSMEPLINDGSYCVFRAPVIGTRENKIVLVQYHGIEDPDYGGSYTIKKYTSRKSFSEEGGWKHEEIVLQSLNPGFQDIVLTGAGTVEFTVIGEYVAPATAFACGTDIIV